MVRKLFVVSTNHQKSSEIPSPAPAGSMRKQETGIARRADLRLEDPVGPDPALFEDAEVGFGQIKLILAAAP